MALGKWFAKNFCQKITRKKLSSENSFQEIVCYKFVPRKLKISTAISNFIFPYPRVDKNERKKRTMKEIRKTIMKKSVGLSIMTKD